MLKTVAAFVYVVFYVLFTLPILVRVSRLHRAKRSAEADRITHDLAQSWAKTFFDFTGSKVTPQGLEHVPREGAVLFVANHQGLFDIMLLLGYIRKPKGFIAKKEIRKLPVVSTWMKFMGCIFMDRKNLRQSLVAINRGAELLKTGHSLVIFPEGHRSKDGKLLPFKPGALKLAVKSGAPIVPVTIDGTNRIMGGGGWRIRASAVSLTISPPLLREEYEGMDIHALSEKIKRVIAEQLPDAW